MRYQTGGESHGRALVAIVTRVPAGIPIEPGAIDADLARRQGGYGRGGRQQIEKDRVSIISGVRFGKTIGSPIVLSVANRDWDNWLDVMAPTGAKPEGIRETCPRPGHADLPGMLKIGSDDARDILERASARETAARVASAGIAKAFLSVMGVEVRSAVLSIGGVVGIVDAERLDTADVESSAVRCPDPIASEKMKAAIEAARREGETLGGRILVVASGVVPGLGSYAEANRRLDSQLAAAVMSIPAIKGVEFGDGFELADRAGSASHDALYHDADHGYHRLTNRAGGLEGGMTNGSTVVVRAAMKPIPTLMCPLPSVDFDTHEPVDASKERSDVCAVPSAAVVAEGEVAFVLARAYMEKFGSDCLEDIVGALETYRERISR